MLRLPSGTTVAFALVAVLGLSSVACNRVRVDDVRGPDATDWKRISCTRMDKKCFKAAELMCPNGYYFAKASGSPGGTIVETDEGEIVTTPGARRTAPHPQAGVNARTLPPQSTWGPGMYSRKRGTILVQCASNVPSHDS